MLPSICFIALIPIVASLPTPGTKYPWLATRISSLKVNCERDDGKDLRTCNMKFDFYDPNSEPVQEVNGAHCDVSWNWDGKATERGPKNNFIGGFSVCSNAEQNLFQVQIKRFHSASDWMIVVSHRYFDDVHFKAPLNMPNSFTEFEMPKLHPGGTDDEELGQFRYETDETIEAPVRGLS